MPTALTICGSLRTGSINRKLVTLMGKRLVARGADVIDLDLGQFDLPIFNGDLEQHGQPAAARALAAHFAAADIIFIASPEYNGSMTPLIKNSIDWISRQKGVNAFGHAVFGLGAVTGGKLAGVQAISHLHDVLVKLNALVAMPAIGVGEAATAFAGDGDLVAGPVRDRADLLADRLIALASR